MPKRAFFANIVLGVIVILFISIFVYALIKNNSHATGSMNKYYFISAAGFLFFSYVLLQCNVEMKVKIALLTLSIILSIYAIEIILSYSSKAKGVSQSRANLAGYMGITFDSRAIIKVVSDLRVQGNIAYPLYNPYSNMKITTSAVFPLGYISNKKTVFCNESGEHIIFTTDEHGFNNPKGIYDDKNVDYLLIGDSFTQGACVKREENIAGRLTKAGKKILNLGMLNSSPLNQLAILKEYGKHVRPKAVIWFFYEGNDHEGLAFEKKSPFFLKYLDSAFTQDIIHKQELVDDVLMKYVDGLLTEYMETTLNNENALMDKTAINTDKHNTGKEAAPFNNISSIIKLSQLRKRLAVLKGCECKVDPLLNDIFAEAKHIVDGWSGQLYFVYLPAWERYPEKANYCREFYLNIGKKGVLSIIKALQIPVVDIESAFSAHPDPLTMFPFRIKGHYNSKGYMFVAEQLEKFLSAAEKM
jgi:hypothetical protein